MQITRLPEKELKDRIDSYRKILAARYQKSRPPSAKWRPEIFDHKEHWQRMGRDHMQAALVVEYIKYVLGKHPEDKPDQARLLKGVFD
jgi:hypothetical protein